MPTTTARPKTGQRRADAVRNVERILEAAIECLSDRPGATMADIAKAAGLGRVTLYGHFASRAELLEAVLTRIIDQGESLLNDVPLEGNPLDALDALIASSWRLVDQSKSIITAAESELSADRIRDLHDNPAARVEALIKRGRADGSIRTDMPTSWQVAVLHQILHGAGAEVASGRLDARDAPELISNTVHSMFTT
jgi:TetR/AcrR family transcriptional repressor of mexCD-oprJ operon